MKNILSQDQIRFVIDWMNTWEQLRDTAIPLRFKEEFSEFLDKKEAGDKYKEYRVTDEEASHFLKTTKNNNMSEEVKRITAKEAAEITEKQGHGRMLEKVYSKIERAANIGLHNIHYECLTKEIVDILTKDGYKVEHVGVTCANDTYLISW